MNSPMVQGLSNGVDRVAGAIRTAAQRTGVDFSYLYGQAKIESGFNPSAKASTSSATGLYQFIDQSWLSVVKKHGAAHGLGWAADCIDSKPGRGLCVRDPAVRQAVMDLRKNPEAAALMAAEHASDNASAITRATGRAASATDLYMAHFLGSGGAVDFLTAMNANPNASAASVAPSAANANRPVFYNGDGSPRTLGEVYNRFAAKIGDSAGAPAFQFADDSDEPSMPPMLYQALSGGPAFDLVRPSPETARLAYLSLTGLGA